MKVSKAAAPSSVYDRAESLGVSLMKLSRQTSIDAQKLYRAALLTPDELGRIERALERAEG